MAAEFEGVFGEDYIHFYEPNQPPELSDRQAALIADLLDLKAAARVLDVPCGYGRITERLAALGCDVVGVDSSTHFIERARSQAPDLDYREGDMRSLEFEGEFDAVVNWFTSFGYFDDETDRGILRSFRRALRPGGRLLIDHQNRDRVLPFLGRGRVWVEERDDDLMIDRTAYDPLTGRSNTERIIVRGGVVRRTRFSVRMFTPTELRDWLLQAGFQKVATFGEDGGAYTAESIRMILVASA